MNFCLKICQKRNFLFVFMWIIFFLEIEMIKVNHIYLLGFAVLKKCCKGNRVSIHHHVSPP